MSRVAHSPQSSSSCYFDDIGAEDVKLILLKQNYKLLSLYVSISKNFPLFIYIFVWLAVSGTSSNQTT